MNYAILFEARHRNRRKLQMTVNLEEMLAARDRRAEIQNEMLSRGGQASCLACLTLNIAGDVKRSSKSRMLFERGLAEFNKLGFKVLDYIEIDEATGSEAFWLLDENAEEVKNKLEKIEENSGIAASRLFDFDVLVQGKANGGGDCAPVKLSRTTGRTCLLCDKPAAECARNRTHGLDAIKEETDRMLREFCSDTLAQAAYDALIAELEATPKPGLVDLNNNGAHKDMNPETFRKSAAALISYFKDAALLGMGGCSMKELRARGIEADRSMFEATGGVNTHQGMIYSMGLLLAGMGKSLTQGGDYIDNATSLAKEDADRDFGATAHAVAGFPDAIYCAERLEMHRKKLDENAAAVFALIDSIARIDDSNILRRGGSEGLQFARDKAAEIAALPTDERLSATEEFDREMIRRNLSPGGSADMLALAFLITELIR